MAHRNLIALIRRNRILVPIVALITFALLACGETSTVVAPKATTPIVRVTIPPACQSFADSFPGPNLDAAWSWIPGTGGTYAVGGKSQVFGTTTILVNAPANADIYPGNYNAPRLLYPSQSNKFTMSTRATYFGAGPFPYIGAGLLVWQDSNNYARLEYAIRGTQSNGVDPALGIEFDVMDNGQYHRVDDAATNPYGSGAFSPVWLKLTQSNGQIAASWGMDGTNYTAPLPYPRTFTTPQVGLDVINISANQIAGIFGTFNFSSCV